MVLGGRFLRCLRDCLVRALVASLAVVILAAVDAPPARAGCDIIPGTQKIYRGRLGSVDRPFAGPDDFVELRLSQFCDGGTFQQTQADYVVAVAFTPPDYPPRRGDISNILQGSVDVVPPEPGVAGGMVFPIPGGVTYCVTFGQAAGGKVVDAPVSPSDPTRFAKTFKIMSTQLAPTAEAGRPGL